MFSKGVMKPQMGVIRYTKNACHILCYVFSNEMGPIFFQDVNDARKRTGLRHSFEMSSALPLLFKKPKGRFYVYPLDRT